MAAMKENSKKVLAYLQEHAGEDLTAADIKDAVGLEKRQVDGIFTAFQKKELGFREEAEIINADGSHVKVKFLRLTDAGMNYTEEAE